MDFLSMDQVQEKYNISKATALNWVRLGNMRTSMEDSLMISRIDLENYHMGRLQNRRNKQEKEGVFVPQRYLKNKKYIKLAQKIIEITNTCSKMRDREEKVLLLIIYKLLLSRGLIHSIEEVIQDVNKLNPKLLSILKIGFTNLDFRGEDYIYLSNILSLEIPCGPDDFLGLLYLSLRQEGQKNKSGSFYTPQSVVETIVDEIKYRGIPKTLDPTCGSGAFLMEHYIKLIKSVGEDKKQEIMRNLHGWDTDKMAVTLCKINLVLLTGDLSVDGIKLKDSLRSNDIGDFDLIIGNPPWGYKFKNSELKELGFEKRPMDSFGMFLLKGMDLLKEKGELCYCLPYSLLNVKSHQDIRQELISKYKIISITDLGKPFDGVFSGSISLKIRKELAQDYSISLCCKDNLVKVQKKHICSLPQYNISFVKSGHTYRIVNKLKYAGSATLANNSTFALGIVTGGNSTHIKSKRVSTRYEPIIKGSEIYKYGIKHQGNYIEFQPEKYQQVAPEEIYRVKEKLIYRFINKSLTFAYDDSGLLTLNSANIVIPNIEGLEMKYIMAILNSRCIQFFYQNVFPSLKVLRHQIEALPIPKASKATQNTIISMVDEMIGCNEARTKEEIYKELDNAIFDLYQLNNEDRIMIIKEVEIKNI